MVDTRKPYQPPADKHPPPDEADNRYKVMKPFTWEERDLVPGTDAEPNFVWMTSAEAKDHVASGNVAAA